MAASWSPPAPDSTWLGCSARFDTSDPPRFTSHSHESRRLDLDRPGGTPHTSRLTCKAASAQQPFQPLTGSPAQHSRAEHSTPHHKTPGHSPGFANPLSTINTKSIASFNPCLDTTEPPTHSRRAHNPSGNPGPNPSQSYKQHDTARSRLEDLETMETGLRRPPVPWELFGSSSTGTGAVE